MIPEYPDHFEPPLARYPTVSFVIPAHNESAYLTMTLEKIHQSASALQLNYEVIVVDDASTDDTYEIAQANGARAIKVDLRNIGAVRNAGAKEARYTCLFFIDADTLVPEKTLKQSLDAICDGAAGGGAHVVIDRIDEVAWTKLVLYYMVRLVWQTMGGWAAGCFMYCRRDLFEHFGGFDEEYFLHVEDIDVCRRARELGGRVIFHPKASVMHYGSTSAVRRQTVEFEKLKGFIYYFRKYSKGWWSKTIAILSIPFMTFAIMGRAWYLALRQAFRGA